LSYTGPNNTQKFPVLGSATVFGNQVRNEGTLSSSTKRKTRTFTIRNATVDTSGFSSAVTGEPL
jgi:hypothetical protein